MIDKSSKLFRLALDYGFMDFKTGDADLLRPLSIRTDLFNMF